MKNLVFQALSSLKQIVILSALLLAATSNAQIVGNYCYDFNPFLGTDWQEATAGTPATGPMSLGTGDWRADDFGNATPANPSARINLYFNNVSDWLITPEFELTGPGPHYTKFDIALTNNGSTAPMFLGSDDEVHLLITDDAGSTWTSLVTWTQSDTISNTGEEIFIDLSAYSGTVQLAFYATDGAVNDPQDIDFFVDNFCIESASETVDCDGSGNTTELNAWLADHGGVTPSLPCAISSWTDDFTALSNDCGATGAATVTFTATDVCSNTYSFQATFTIQDTIIPDMTTLPSDLTLECDGAGNTAAINIWLAANGGAVATDECGVLAWTNDYISISQTCGSAGSTTVTFTAEDECGNARLATAVVTIEDLTAPTIGNPPLDVTFECDGSGNTSDISNWASPAAAMLSDVCNTAITWTHDFQDVSDECALTGIALVTFTATDDCGNTTTTQANISITDITPPTLTTPASNDSAECDGAGNTAEINAWLNNNGGAVAVDVCAGAIWTNDYSGITSGCGGSGSATVNFMAADSCGNSVFTQATFTITNTVPPSIETQAANLTAECDTLTIATVISNWLTSNGGAVASSCGTVTWSNDYTALTDDCGATGSATVTFTASDGCGNSAATVATITIEDNFEPIFITQPIDITVECDGNGNGTDISNWLDSYGGAVVADNCSDITWANNYSNITTVCGGMGSASVTFTAEDECGNSATATATFTIEDSTDPVILCNIPSESVECNAANNEALADAWNANNISLLEACSIDDCGLISVTSDYSFSFFNESCGTEGSITVTYTVEDECGLSTTTNATFSTNDSSPPNIITAASNDTLICDGLGNQTEIDVWLNTNGSATAFDSCGSFTWTNDYMSISDGCGGTGETMVSFTVTDECGNSATTTATIVVIDTLSPQITVLPSDITIECDGNGNTTELNDWLNDSGDAMATDACSILSWTNDFGGLNGNCGMNGVVTVNFTVSDECGNTTSASATLTLDDSTAPAITTAAINMTLECDGNGNINEINTWVNNNGGAVATDDCSNITWTNDYVALSDLCGETGMASVTFTVSDDCGNSSTTSATITVEDTTPPSLIASPQNEVVECDGSGNINELNTWLNSNGGAFASDDCGSIVWANDYAFLSDGCGESGSATVIFTVTDECNNGVTSSATFTIEDTTDPVITTLAQDMIVECDGSGNTTQLNNWLNTQGGAVVEEDCGAISWTNNYSSLSNDCAETGQATITFTATDDCGNATTTSAMFEIADNTGPVFTTLPQNTFINCDGFGNNSQVTAWLISKGGAVAEDACGTVSYSNNYSGLTQLCGTTAVAEVTFTATDICGNTTTAIATLNIQDTIPPTISIVAKDKTVECNGSGNTTELNNWLNTKGSALATDLCSAVTWTNDFDTLQILCGATGIDTVTFIATDACGNTATTTAIFKIEDTTDPTLTDFADNLTVECDGNGNQNELANWLNTQGNAGATDICGDVIWTNDFDTLTNLCGATGSAFVTFIASDACGNSVTTSATFTIEDTTNPIILVEAQNMTVDCGVPHTFGSYNFLAYATWVESQGGAIISEDCSEVVWTNNSNGLTYICGGSGTSTVVFTATDACGHTATTSATFTIQDTVPPSFQTLPEDLTVQCDGSGNNIEISNWLTLYGNAVAVDTCSAVMLSHDYNMLSDSCGATGTATVIFTANDACGNSSTASATITVIDTIPPMIITAAANDTVQCDGQGNTSELDTWLGNIGGVNVSDICSAVTWTNDYSGFSNDCGLTGETTVIFTVADECGNTNTTSATFVIIDTIPPTINTLPSNPVVECDGAGNFFALFNWLNNFGGGVAGDACGTVTWGQQVVGQTDGCGETGVTTVIFIATDQCGNSTSVESYFTIEDTTIPMLTSAAANLTVECDGQGNVTELNAWLDSNGGASAVDVCDTIVWTNDFSSLSNGAGATGNAFVSFTVSDGCNNFAISQAYFKIEDTTAPEFSPAPQNMVVECDGLGNQNQLDAWLNSNGGSTVIEACGIVYVFNDFSSLSNNCGATGTTVVKFTAIDESGNMTEKFASFTIVDTTPPTITTVAEDLDLDCGLSNVTDLNDWLNLNGGAIASDSCGTVNWSHDYIASTFECVNTGWVDVRFTASDACGNSSFTEATYFLTDTINPVITVTAISLTVECDGLGNLTELNNWLDSQAGAMATDECSVLEWTHNYEGIDSICGATGSALVTFTVYDACENSATSQASFTIEDTSVPVIITVAQDSTVECDGAGNLNALTEWLNTNGGATATDNCVAMTWSNDYVEIVNTCGEAGMVTVTFTVSDACQNTATTQANFKIIDSTDPVIISNASSITVECDGDGNQAELNAWLLSNGGAAVQEDCSELLWLNDFEALSNGCGETGSSSVVFTLLDACGNENSTQATFSIVDTEEPIILTVPEDVTVDCDGAGNLLELNAWLDEFGGMEAEDICSQELIWTHDYTTHNYNCGQVQNIAVEFKVEDLCGNYTTAIGTFKIETSCVDPTELSTSNISWNGTTVTWTENGPATEWELEFVDGGDPPTGNATLVTNQNPFVWEGGLPQKEYDVYVRSHCGANVYSDWTGPDKFTTICPDELSLDGLNDGTNLDVEKLDDNESDGKISSIQTITPTAIIDYDSKTEIELMPGFEVKLGAVFEAFIDGCNNGQGGLNGPNFNSDKTDKTDKK